MRKIIWLQERTIRVIQTARCLEFTIPLQERLAEGRKGRIFIQRSPTQIQLRIFQKPAAGDLTKLKAPELGAFPTPPPRIE